MNLSKDWCGALNQAGHEATHWSDVGEPDAADKEVMAYALKHGLVVFTQDLDFSDLLAMSGDDGPSVIQLRDDNRVSERTLALVLRALAEFEGELSSGALVTLNQKGGRARVLPL